MSSVIQLILILGLLGVNSGYDLGVQYLYKYHTQVSSGEDCQKDQESHSKNVGFQLTSTVQITCIWENQSNKGEKLLKIELIKPSLLVPKKSSYQFHDSKLGSISHSPLYIEWIDGEIRTVFGNITEDPVVKNLKKGIGSLLQVKREISSSAILQRDVSGDCLTQFHAYGRFIQKKKENCFHPQAGEFQFSSSEIRSGNAISLSETMVELVARKSNLVLAANGTDCLQMHSNLWKESTVCVHSTTSLSLESENSGAETVSGSSLRDAAENSMPLSDGGFKTETLIAEIIPKECGNSCKDLSKIISGYKESLATKNLAKLKSASSFLKLLETFRLASKEDILSVLQNKKFKSIIPQLLDVTAHAQSRSSVHAAVQALDLFSGDSDLVERLLISLCISSHPDAELLQRILDIVKKGHKNQKVHATLLIALGALTKSYTGRHKGQAQEEVVQNIANFFIQGLKSCKLPECQVVYLRGLRNAALPSSVPVLLEYAGRGGKPALEALLALKSIDHQNFASEAVKVFQEVFHQIQRKQISSSRAVAAELLLISEPSKEIIKSLFDELRKPGNTEFTTFVSSKIYNIIENDEKLRLKVQNVFAEVGMKYHEFFLKGSSVSFTKPLMSTSDVNVTFAIEMEMLPGGSLKRSLFDVNLFTHESNLQVLSVGIYAEGLSSLGGTDESLESDDAADATAGMELRVLGVALRPYVFFESSSELFGLVWNGVGNTPTPALQGNMLLIDDSTTVVLHNGFLVDLNLKGVLSADLSAFIEISMWYKNSHSVVNNTVALLVKGSAHIDSSFINIQEEFSFMGESAIEFITDSDFSDAPFKMCHQMEQPQFLFRSNVLVAEHIPGSKYSVKLNRKRKLSVPARSFSLYPENNDHCVLLLDMKS